MYHCLNNSHIIIKINVTKIAIIYNDIYSTLGHNTIYIIYIISKQIVNKTQTPEKTMNNYINSKQWTLKIP